MAEFSWAYINSEAVVKVDGPTGSVQYRVADAAGHTVMSGSDSLMWHTASSQLEVIGEMSASTYAGDGSGLTNVAGGGSPAGNENEIQFNDGVGAFTASSDLTWNGTSLTITGEVSASAMSASTYAGDGSGLTGIGAHTLPAGNANEIQFNDGIGGGIGAFGASSDLTWNGTSLTITGEVSASAMSASTYVGDGSGLTNLPVSDPFPYTGDVEITGTLDVSGSISRHGFLQLGINTEQSESVVDLTGSMPPNPIISYTVSWNDVVRKDDSFYSFDTTTITLEQSGDYKISYCVNFKQVLPNAARSNMRTWLEKKQSIDQGSFGELNYSRAYSYLRGSGDSDWGSGLGQGTTRFGTNTVVTIVSGAGAGNLIKLNFAIVGGSDGGAWQMKLPPYETWITIEKI